MMQRGFILTLMLALSCLNGGAEGEYTGRYLYRQGEAKDTGGLRITLAVNSPRPTLAVAVGQRSREPYLGSINADGTIDFQHLPVDRYDLLLVTETSFYEGFSMIQDAQETVPEADAAALHEEVAKIEGFFDRKQIHRIRWAPERACVLVQQWRAGLALKHSGEKVSGSIHSLDLIWFEKPLKGWQLVRRRQVYRQELPEAKPLKNHYLAELSGLRVIKSVTQVGPLNLN